jgi:hypothetical protein
MFLEVVLALFKQLGQILRFIYYPVVALGKFMI